MPRDRLFLTSILFSLILRTLRLMTTYCNLEWPAFEVGWPQEGGFQFLMVSSVKGTMFQKSSIFSLLMLLYQQKKEICGFLSDGTVAQKQLCEEDNNLFKRNLMFCMASVFFDI